MSNTKKRGFFKDQPNIIKGCLGTLIVTGIAAIGYSTAVIIKSHFEQKDAEDAYRFDHNLSKEDLKKQKLKLKEDAKKFMKKQREKALLIRQMEKEQKKKESK